MSKKCDCCNRTFIPNEQWYRFRLDLVILQEDLTESVEQGGMKEVCFECVTNGVLVEQLGEFKIKIDMDSQIH